MKKIIILNLAVLFMASAAFAATSATGSISTFGSTGLTVVGDGGPATGASIGKLSTKVGMGWNTTSLGYAFYTQHLQGTKGFGTSFDSTSIYTKDVSTIGKDIAPTLTTGADSFSGWTTM